MACGIREDTGTCNHDQCPYPDETTHGYECVEFIWLGPKSLCEVGDGCLSKCPHSWVLKAEEEAALKMLGDN